jgi:hypothetical protein
LAGASGLESVWQNDANRFDVNADTRVTPNDALVICNAILRNGGKPLVLAETSLPTGYYPDVKADGIVSAADFDAVVGELNRRLSFGGGGFSQLSGDNEPPQATGDVDDFLRWGESDETDTISGWMLFDDPDHDDTELTYTSTTSGATNIFDSIDFDPVTGNFVISYVIGEGGTGTVTLRATDPEGLYDEVEFEVTSILVTGYDLQWKDQGNWTTVPSDEGILTDDELRARPQYTPIPPGFVVPIAWKHKDWADASNDLDAGDALSGNWQYPTITAQYSDGAGGTWFEFQLPEADWGLTPELFLGAFRHAAQMLPAKEENVYDIQDPVWEGIELSDGQTNFEEDGNPAEFGGGDRFFAERNLPTGRTGSVLHDSVNLVVSLDRNVRPGRHVPVAVKLLDPDHYANTPFDNNDTILWNPEDNIRAGGALTKDLGLGTNGTGGDLATSVNIVENTKSIKTPLQVLARQPTNNFRSAAFNPRVPATNIDFGMGGTFIVRLDKPGELVHQTPILTIWRHLYIELDSMDQPLFAQGPAPSLIASGYILSVSADRKTLTTDRDLEDGAENQFQGGFITLFDGSDQLLGRYAIAANTEEDHSTITLVDPLPVDVAARVAYFAPLEDDDIEHDVTAGDMIPDVSLFASRFRPACIEFDPDKSDLAASSDAQVNQIAQIPFDQNTLTSEYAGLHDTWRQSASELDFWSAYLVGVFQPEQEEDNDNDDEFGTGGTTNTQVPISLIFRETVRDIEIEEPDNYKKLDDEDRWRVVGLHEVGHQFWLGHWLTDDGTIMHYESMQTKPVEELVFSPDGLRKITERDYPREAIFIPDPP